MNIAPTNSTKTNYIGSIFGWTRNNGSKRHRGLDLYAPEGTPVYAMYDGKISMAVNTRTGTTFKPGDEVFAGEIVGYTGRTGNAYDVDYPHLHLGILSGSEYLNPEFFINGSVQWSDDSRTNLPDTEINNIRCDEENNAENQYDL